MHNYRLLLIATLLLSICCACSKVDVSGQWSGKVTNESTGISIENIDVVINQQANKLTGNINILIKDIVWQSGITGVIEKNKVVFNTENKDGLYLNFNGLVTNDILSGSSDVTMQGTRVGTVRESYKFTFNKKK